MLEVFAHGDSQRVWISDAPARLQRAGDLLSALTLSTSERITTSPGATLFSSARVSSGEYRLVNASRTPAAGTLFVTIGRSETPLLRLDAAQLSLSDGLRLTLPQRVNALVITGDDGARQTMARIRLQPVRVDAGVSPDAAVVRAARYGAVLAPSLKPRDSGLRDAIRRH
jgi:hypothetical protein